jgi:7-keto-8-aminopelargonate synthetase-like enzyme
MLSKDTSLRDRLEKNTAHFRKSIKEAGFKVLGDDHCPIVSGN